MPNRRKTQRKQRGGSPTFAYTGETIQAAGGAPFPVWSAANPHCGTDLRVAPLVGGRRSHRKRNQSQSQRKSQRGGGCACAGGKQWGGSSGGYHPLLNNDVGKMIPAFVRAPCLTPQVGGDLISSVPSGYGLVTPYNSDNANFMEYKSYGRSMMGGKRRSKKNNKRR
jgi:hypothetical protein